MGVRNVSVMLFLGGVVSVGISVEWERGLNLGGVFMGIRGINIFAVWY